MAHADQAEPGPSRDTGLWHGESLAVVVDIERHRVAHEGQRQDHVRCAGMPGDVRQGLLGGPQQGDLDLRMQSDDIAGDRDIDRDGVYLRPFAGDVGQCSGKRAGLERARQRRRDLTSMLRVDHGLTSACEPA